MVEASYVFVLAFCRVFGFMQMMPNIGNIKIPTGIRFVVFLAITPYMVPAALMENPPTITEMELAFLAMKEMILGMFMGLAVSLPLRLPQLIGDLIDNQRGTAVTNTFNPFSGEESSIIGQLLMLMVVTYFYTEHGLDYLIGILAGSFALQPVTSYTFGFGADFFHVYADITSNYLKLFAMLSLPAVVILFLIDMSLGVTSKFAPTMNISSISPPVKAVLAIGILLSVHPRITSSCIELFRHTAGYFV